MKLIATKVKTERGFFHVRLAKGIRRFCEEMIVARHIGARPWSEASWVDRDGHVHQVYGGTREVIAEFCR